MRFLIVDDDEMARFILVRVVERAFPECLITTAECGEQALQLLAPCGEPALIVLSDYSMGNHMNGLDFLAQVRERRPDAARILVTAHFREELEPRVSDAKLDGFVEKGANFGEFARAIEESVRRAVSPAIVTTGCAPEANADARPGP